MVALRIGRHPAVRGLRLPPDARRTVGGLAGQFPRTEIMPEVRYAMISLSQAALRAGIGTRRLRTLCKAGRIPGAQLISARMWLVPDKFRVLPGAKVGNPNWRKK